MTTLTHAAPGRVRAAWTAAHAPVPGVPHWARIAAYTIPFTVLPSGIWRIAMVAFPYTLAPAVAPQIVNNPDQIRGDVPAWVPMQAYVIILSIVSELLAFTAVGLISSWGEVFPRWIPMLRGRRVPTLAAVIPAALGAVFLTSLWTLAAVNITRGRTLQGERLPADLPLNFDDWHGVVALAAYAPLLLWGPLLAAVTVAYWRRRRGRT